MESEFVTQSWKTRVSAAVRCMLMGLLMLACSGAYAQDKGVTGKVVDEKGQPLVGVNVVVKGITQGTSTSMDGSFQLGALPKDAVLVFSFIGYQTAEIPAGTKTHFDVTLMEDRMQIDNVVVIGYGAVKKTNITGSVAKVDGEAFASRPLTNLAEGLQGQLAGVRAQATSGAVGAEPRIRIRGNNTITGDSNPLFVVDGIVRDGITDLNPTDIESIQVLKDASTAAIYGARGGNGVIVVTTKKGTGRPVVSFDANWGWSEVSKKMDMMNKNEYLAFQTWRRNKEFMDQGGDLSSPWGERASGYRVPDEWLSGDVPYTDWQDAVTQKGFAQSYQVSASGSSDVGSIYFSAGYVDQSGVMKETYYNRMNFRLNGSLNLGKRVRVGINIAPTFIDKDLRQAEGKEAVYQHALTQNPMIALDEATDSKGVPSYVLGQVYVNPLVRLQERTDNTRTTNVLTSIWGEVDVLKNLKFRTQYGYDYYSSVYEAFCKKDATGNDGSGKGKVYGNSWSTTSAVWSIQNTLTFNKSFGGVHNLDVMIGQSAESKDYYKIEAAGTDWPNDIVPTLNQAVTPTTAKTNKSMYRTASFFGRVQYDYKEKYLLSVSARYDGSSRFGMNQKWGFFPSVSAGWKISEEGFMSNVEWIDLLKIRGSYGVSGNDRIGDYKFLSMMSQDKFTWGDKIVGGYAPSSMANADLQWEETHSMNFGVDFSVLKNRIQLNLDYYVNNTKSLLYNVPTPQTTGFGSMLSNIGEIRNSGFELDLTTHNLIGKFKWSSQLNLSANRNKVMALAGEQVYDVSHWTGAIFRTAVGLPISTFRCYRTNGILTEADFDDEGNALVPIKKGQQIGSYKYVNMDGDDDIDENDIANYGSNQPKLLYGFTNTFSWKNFDLRIFLQGQFGGKIMFQGHRAIDCGAKDLNNFKRWVRGYKAPVVNGQDPVYNGYGVDMSWDGKTPDPLAKGNEGNIDQRIYDATFLSIRNLTFGYNVPAKFVNKCYIKGLRVYFSVDNLAMFSDYPGVSPDADSYGNGNTQLGIDYCTTPATRRYVFGVNLTF